MSKYGKKATGTHVACGKPWGDHTIKITAGSPEWACPGTTGISCVCGKPDRPGRHGTEFCSRG